ncbi:uncharacterized protein [Fopius arisanus]|uniref:Odorant receptor n=1 Tax=Fopius arisanus TaxID=64838 RepID=A0A9R1U4B9_9HYME|nr:PREDICTED: uncharacterized protein LOC105269751 isoform X2 [Fopius arisanus]
MYPPFYFSSVRALIALFIRCWSKVKMPSKSSKQKLSHDHDSAVEYELQYTRWVLKTLGIWPMLSDRSTSLDRIVSFFLIILNLFAIAFILIPCVLHVLFREKNPRKQLLLLGPIGFRVSNILKYFSIMLRVDTIKQCFNHVKNDWLEMGSEVEESLVLKNITMGRNLTRFCAVFMFSAGVFYHTVMPLLRKKKVNAFNVTIRPHAYPGYDFFVDPQASPAYEIIFGAHCLFAVANYLITIAACNFAATFVSHICGQVQVMNLRLQGLNQCNEEKFTVAERIASIIKCHVKLLRLSKMIEKILREICMVEVVASTLIICLLEYYCMTEWKNSDPALLIAYLLLLTSLTFNIFIFCYIGEILKHQIPCENILKLSLIIAISRTPQKITAGGMMDLTIRSFGGVIKTSVAYLNMLRAMADS